MSGYRDLHTSWQNVREPAARELASAAELRAGLAEQQRQIDALQGALAKQAPGNASTTASPGLTAAVLTSSMETFQEAGDAVHFMVSVSPDRPAKGVSFCLDAPDDVLYLGIALFGNSEADRRRMGVEQPRRVNNGRSECWTLDQMDEGDKFILLYPGIRKSSEHKINPMPKLDIKAGKGFSLRSSNALYRPLPWPVLDIKGQQAFAQDGFRPQGSSNSKGILSSTLVPAANIGETVDVYTDADAAGNHFAARGEFDNLQADRVATMDEISTAAPCLGITCITATFDPDRTVWGVVFPKWRPGANCAAARGKLE